VHISARSTSVSCDHRSGGFQSGNQIVGVKSVGMRLPSPNHVPLIPCIVVSIYKNKDFVRQLMVPLLKDIVLIRCRF